MNAESRLLVTDEPDEFEKYLVEVQDFRNILDRFRGIFIEYNSNIVKQNRKMSTCNR